VTHHQGSRSRIDPSITTGIRCRILILHAEQRPARHHPRGPRLALISRDRPQDRHRIDRRQVNAA
jgi:hypothetical protein